MRLAPAPKAQAPQTGSRTEQQAELVETLARLNGVVGDVSGLLKRLTPGIIGEELIALDANGTATKSFRVPFRAISVDSYSAKTLTIAAHPLREAAPGPGPGAAQVGPGGYSVINFEAYQYSVYGGSPGDLVVVTAFREPQPPIGTAVGPNGLVVTAPPPGLLVVGAAGGLVTAAASDYPTGAVPITADSGNQANAVATATLAAAAAAKTWITGFEVTGTGATGALVVTVTVTGVVGGPLHYTYVFVAGATTLNTPLIVEFPKPIPTPAVNSTIAVSCPASGVGGTNNTVVAHGYQL